MTHNTDKQMSDLGTRDAHLTELTVNRYLAGELDDAETEFVDQHVAECAACSGRIDAVKKFDAGFSIAPPMPAPAPVTSLAEEREKRRSFAPIIGLVAAAAAVALVVMVQQPAAPTLDPGEPDDGIRLKGSGLAIGVFAKAGDASPRRVGNGDVVHPGDRLGFELTSDTDGYVLIVGIDSSGELYPAWPTSGKGKFLAGEPGPRDLEAAIQLDSVGSSEEMRAYRCQDPVSVLDIKRGLGGPSLAATPQQDSLENCVYDGVQLTKQPR